MVNFGNQPQIQEAWKFRYAGKIGPAQKLLRDLQSVPAAGPREQSEICLLQASFARHELRMEEANKYLAQARAALHDAGLADSFQFLMQTALCLLAESKQVEALRFLKRAEEKAENSYELQLAKVNILTCLYNLNLPYETALKELLELGLEANFLKSIEPIQLISMKSDFHQGRMRQLTEGRMVGDLGQAHYVRAWVASMPWVQNLSARDNFVERCLGSESLFQKDYRLQTLVADPRHTEIAEESFFHLQVDRIFLWTWQWMQKPDSNLRSLLERELAQFDFASAPKRCSDEDLLLLESAFGWLSIFNTRFARRAAPWIATLSRVEPFPSPFFELDREVRKILTKTPSGAVRLLAELKTQNSSENDFAAYLAFVISIVHKFEMTDGNEIVLVDSATETLSVGGKKLVSSSATYLLELLKEQGSAEFSEVLEAAFQIPGYDSHVHGPKINNLLQRVKGLMPPSVKLMGRAERIYFEDPQNLVRVLKPSLQAAHFPDFEWPAEEEKKSQSQRAEMKQEQNLRPLLYQKFRQGEVFSREEIQLCLGLSKPTSVRLIAKWLEDRTLTRRGHGPASRYFLT